MSTVDYLRELCYNIFVEFWAVILPAGGSIKTVQSIYMGNPPDVKRVYACAETLLKNEANCESYLTRDDVLAGKAKNVEYIFATWGMPTFTEEEINTFLPALKTVFYAAGTVRYFAEPFLKCGVRVHSAWAANAIPVAEYAVAQIILANKGYYMTSPLIKRREIEASHTLRDAMPGNFHTKVGLIGVGMIGSLVAEKLHLITDLDILAYDPFMSPEKAKRLGITSVSLETLFSECQTVSNHLANNAETQGILNGKLFDLLPPHAVFINTGRGAQVVESDLAAYLASHPTACAILDVTYPEPPLPDSPLYTLPNVILTPHIAGSNGHEVGRMAMYMVDEYRAELDGGVGKYSVSLEMLKTMA